MRSIVRPARRYAGIYVLENAINKQQLAVKILCNISSDMLYFVIISRYVNLREMHKYSKDNNNITSGTDINCFTYINCS